MIKHKIFLGILFIEISLVGLFYATACWSVKNRQPELRLQQQLVSCLMLTDLALWTEATYTRHPSQTDFFTPFQDFPGAIEHFPAGSLSAPPLAGGFTPSVSDGCTITGE